MGKAPKVPPPPPPSAQETELLNKQGQVLDQYMKTIDDTKAQNKQQGMVMALSSGLYDPVYDGSNLVDVKLNPAKIATLQEDFGRNEDVNRMLLDRYEKAIRGELPVSEALTQQKARDFGQLQEKAARQGATITGGSLDEAATTPQNSTAANELTARLNSTYKLAEDSERRGVLATPPPTLGAQALTLSGQGVQTYGAGVTAPMQIGALGAIPGVLQPYQNDRNLAYNSSVQNAGLKAQRQAAIYGLAGTGAGVGAALALA